MAEHALLHELAHVRRGDLILAAFFGLLRAIYFFHPLVHLAERRLAGLRELCCDRFVARRLGEERVAYPPDPSWPSPPAATAKLWRDCPGWPSVGGRSSLLERLRALERAEQRPPVAAPRLPPWPWPRPSPAPCRWRHAGRRGAAQVAEMIDKPPGCLQCDFW